VYVSVTISPPLRFLVHEVNENFPVLAYAAVRYEVMRYAAVATGQVMYPPACNKGRKKLQDCLLFA
jgi:hypothetical protein